MKTMYSLEHSDIIGVLSVNTPLCKQKEGRHLTCVMHKCITTSWQRQSRRTRLASYPDAQRTWLCTLDLPVRTPALQLVEICNVRSTTLGTQMFHQHRFHVGKRNASISHEACRPTTRQIGENCSCSEHPQSDQEETKGSINTKCHTRKRKENDKQRKDAVTMWYASVCAMKYGGAPTQPSFDHRSNFVKAQTVTAIETVTQDESEKSCVRTENSQKTLTNCGLTKTMRTSKRFKKSVPK